jgi:CRP/FNR family transcriptional regulator, cyclic AMP receptor protein
MGEFIWPGSVLNTGESIPYVHPHDLFPTSHFPKIRRFKRGEVMFHQGDPASSLFVVQNGIAKEMIRHTTGEEYITALATRRNPVILGLEGLADEPHATTAAAVNGVTVQSIPRQDVEAIMNTNPDYTLALSRHISQATRSRNLKLADTAFMDIPARLAVGLLEAADQLVDYAVNTEGLPEFSQLTQSDLASMIGINRISVCSLLGYWTKKGYLRRDGRRVIIQNVDAIESIGRNQVVMGSAIEVSNGQEGAQIAQRISA